MSETRYRRFIHHAADKAHTMTAARLTPTQRLARFAAQRAEVRAALSDTEGAIDG